MTTAQPSTNPAPASTPASSATGNAPAPNPGPATPAVAANPPAGLEVGQAVNKPIAMSSFPHSSSGQNKFSALSRAETLSLLHKHASRLGLFKAAEEKEEKKAPMPKEIDIHLRKADPKAEGPKQIDLKLKRADGAKGVGQSAAVTAEKAAGLLGYLNRPEVQLGMLKHASDKKTAARIIVAAHRAKQRLFAD